MMNFNIFKGEDLAGRVLVRTWLQEKAHAGQDDKEICEFLIQHGKSFSRWYDEYPPNVPMLDPLMAAQDCHRNTVTYAQALGLIPGIDLRRFKFVLGYFGLHAKIENHEAPYMICHHSFMLYDDVVLDCTKLKFPSVNHKIDQYFGLELDVHKFNRLILMCPDVKQSSFLNLIKHPAYRSLFEECV